MDAMFGARVHLSPRKFLQFQPIVRKFMRSSSALSPNVGTERQENSPYVEKVNGILRQYPLESAGTLIGLEISSISSCIAMLKLLGEGLLRFLTKASGKSDCQLWSSL